MGEIVSLALDLLVEPRLVLEVVRIQSALVELLVGDVVVVVLDDLEVEARILGELVVDEADDIAVRHRRDADLEGRDAVRLGADLLVVASDEAAACKHEGRGGCGGSDLDGTEPAET